MGQPGGFHFPVRHAFLSEKGALGFRWVGGTLIFVVASGLAIWLGPFSAPVEFAIVMHTALGLILIIPLTLWQFSHWLATRRARINVRKFCGYAGIWTMAATLVSGLVLSWQAIFSLDVVRFWDRLHLWSGVAAIPFLIYHVWPHVWKPANIPGKPQFVPPDYSPGRRWIWRRAVATALALLVVLVIVSTAYVTQAPNFTHYAFPAGYKLPYGKNPFFPSLATTVNDKPVPPVLLADSKTCGASGCHTAIYQEWSGSAHRWAAEDPLFQKVQAGLIKSDGIPAARYCAGCHDPVSLLSGYKDASTGIEAPGFKEGISCVACHGMRRVDVQGNGNYVFAPPKPYLFEYYGDNGATVALTHFLIRAYPHQHDYDYDLSLVKQPASCASCHKQYIDKSINHVGWVQLQNQYDDWRMGKWNTAPNPADRLRCQQCHMYYESAANRSEADPYDRKIGLGLKHRNHWFAATNQFVPAFLHTPDWRNQDKRVDQWLAGKKVIPEIASIWPTGPVMPIELFASEPIATPGRPFKFQVMLVNNKAGHSVPTGPLDLIRLWVEVQVHDRTGRVVYHSGELTPQDHIESNSFVLKGIGVNAAGETIVRHDLWNEVGAKGKRVVFPGYTDMYRYQFVVPGNADGPLTITAKLRYRKANQYMMDWAFPGQHRETPITNMSSDQLVIPIQNGARTAAATRDAEGKHAGLAGAGGSE